MKVFNFIEVVMVFHSLVLHGNTGNAATFAKRLGVSRSTLYNLLDDLESYGIEIEYCRERKTYRYQHPELVEIKVLICQHTSE